MKFVRAIWKLLVGIKDALVLIFMLLFFGMLYGACRRGRRRSRTASSTSISMAASSSSPSRAQWSDVAGGSRIQAISASRPRPRARQGDGRQPREGGRARSRRIHRRRPDRDRRPRRRGPPGARAGQAGDRLWRRLHQRQLRARLGGVGDLAEPARRRADHRAGRIEPLLQGPARQARGDRERLSRRHLQVGGRAVHPQRHVARGASRITWRSTRPARELAAERQAGAAEGQHRPVPDRT